jgi:outer membrane protein assembly factor BamB
MEHKKHKTINTGNLWEKLKLYSENISIDNDEVKLAAEFVYKSSKEVINKNDLDMTDIAVDECDNIYICDRKKKVLLIYENEIMKEINLPLELNSPSGIGIDKDTIYIADSGNHQLIAIARYNFQIRWILSKNETNNPFGELSDIIVGNDGYIYMLEKDKMRVIKVGRKGNILYTIGGQDGILSQPSDISIDSGGNIYVLDDKLGDKFVLMFDDKTHKAVQIKCEKVSSPSGISVDKDKSIFIGEANKFATETISKFNIEDGSLLPLWVYRDTTRKLINDSKGSIYVINGDGNKLTLLKHEKVNKSSKGTYISQAIDSRSIKMRWHRVLLNGEFKSGTQIKVSYYASDIKPENPEDEKRLITDLPQQSWTELISGASSIQCEEKRDALFQRKTENRYLWFRIELHGSETLSPILKKLTVYFPRSSYLDYLPAIYREDVLSEDFLERFLSIFESIFQEAELSIDGITRFFDALGTPPEFLSWLA